MDNAEVYSLHRGTAPLLLSLPHVGTLIPDDQRPRYVQRAFDVEDTDWHLDRLYDFARDLGATLLVPRHSRYLIDLNRPPENTPMYPGANNTELCPTRFFTGDPLYHDGQAPDALEIARRVERCWRPYHAALRAELDRLRQAHGHVVLWDGHSIKGELPWLFEGRLWDLNLGTADGASCAPGLQAAVAAVLAGQDRFSHVVNGRFKGGYITRQYGAPGAGIHAVQLEMCWSTYLRETAPHAWAPEIAQGVQPLLRALLAACLAWQP
ncbi:MAG: N-formylglutamate deformylase [Burkholderiales bacterium]|nr:N-formylglutamate deformylase [Burkholderiales bacterium]